MGKGKTENLKPPRTTEEARARGKNGGIKSGQVRREKKLLSELYTEYLAKRLNSKDKNFETIIDGVLLRFDSSSVSMMKEIREATEGSKMKLSGDSEMPIQIVINPIEKK